MSLSASYQFAPVEANGRCTIMALALIKSPYQLNDTRLRIKSVVRRKKITAEDCIRARQIVNMIA